jgi:hypothetical protein
MLSHLPSPPTATALTPTAAGPPASAARTAPHPPKRTRLERLLEEI